MPSRNQTTFKKFFFLIARTLPPLPFLTGRATNERTFLPLPKVEHVLFKLKMSITFLVFVSVLVSLIDDLRRLPAHLGVDVLDAAVHFVVVDYRTARTVVAVVLCSAGGMVVVVVAVCTAGYVVAVL